MFQMGGPFLVSAAATSKMTGCDEEAKVWNFIGSRSCLLRFRDALLEYAADSSNDYASEHEYYGPYYLEIMTWPEAGFSGCFIAA